MAIPIKFLGRVESDPMRVPTAASMARTDGDRFDRLLRDSVATDETPVDADGVSRDEQPETPEQTAAPADDAPARSEPEGQPSNGDDSVNSEPATQARGTVGAAPDADVTESTHRGEPERQKTAGKGTDSPRTSSANSEPLIAATLQSPAAQARLLPGVQPTTQQPATANARAGEPLVRGADGTAATGNTTAKAQRAQAGYGTRSAASAQMLEQARDSVFKQILMKLTDNGGEMRLRLQPPDLGELDLRLTVEAGNKLSLAIASDQKDMLALLQRHLDELKSTLQQNGLEITGAEVQTRSEFQRDQDAAGESAGAATQEPTDSQSDDATAARRTGGYVTAQGLDFWA